jgi:hypothetical protein
MKQAVTLFVFAVLFAATAYASDSIKEFSFTTSDGKSVEFKAGSGSATVVKICAPW